MLLEILSPVIPFTVIDHAYDLIRKRPSLGRLEGLVFNTEPDLKVKQNNRASSELVVLLRSTNRPCLTRGLVCARWSPAFVHDICLMQTGTPLFRIILGHHVQLSTSKFQ